MTGVNGNSGRHQLGLCMPVLLRTATSNVACGGSTTLRGKRQCAIIGHRFGKSLCKSARTQQSKQYP